MIINKITKSIVGVPHCIVIIILFILIFFNQSCNRVSSQKPVFQTEYQAVFLDNGQTFFGKIEKTDSAYPLLKDVFYIQSQVDKDSKEVKPILVKMGQEWNAPDLMYIRANHIVRIEPVSVNSRVAQLMKEAKTKR